MFSSEVTVLEHRRGEERLPADVRARYGTGGRPERALCRVLDVTTRGARLEVFCDLPRGTKSGLHHVIEVLKDVPGISFTHFQPKDVVRHPLVQRIVEAYERFETRAEAARETSRDA